MDHPSQTAANRCHNLPPPSTLTYPIITLPSTRRTREYSSDLSQTPILDFDPHVTERENTMYPTELRVCLPPIQGNSLSPTSSSGHSFHQTSSDNSRRLSTWFNHTSLMSNASSGSIEVETPTSISELRVRLPPITENNSNLSRSSSRISTGIRGSEPMRTTPSIQESTIGQEASVASGSRMRRWLHMSDDHPPDYDEIASPPSYLEAIKGQYCRRHTSLRRDYPTISSHNLKEQRNRRQYSNLLWTTDMMYSEEQRSRRQFSTCEWTTDMMYSGIKNWNSEQQF